jgi:hypothetical protein
VVCGGVDARGATKQSVAIAGSDLRDCCRTEPGRRPAGRAERPLNLVFGLGAVLSAAVEMEAKAVGETDERVVVDTAGGIGFRR